ncbi:hypothetical protein P7C73_g278, partial [Tremellales sp. Uapishka_1]
MSLTLPSPSNSLQLFHPPVSPRAVRPVPRISTQSYPPASPLPPAPGSSTASTSDPSYGREGSEDEILYLGSSNPTATSSTSQPCQKSPALSSSSDEQEVIGPPYGGPVTSVAGITREQAVEIGKGRLRLVKCPWGSCEADLASSEFCRMHVVAHIRGEEGEGKRRLREAGPLIHLGVALGCTRPKHADRYNHFEKHLQSGKTAFRPSTNPRRPDIPALPPLPATATIANYFLISGTIRPFQRKIHQAKAVSAFPIAPIEDDSFFLPRTGSQQHDSSSIFEELIHPDDKGPERQVEPSTSSAGYSKLAVRPVTSKWPPFLYLLPQDRGHHVELARAEAEARRNKGKRRMVDVEKEEELQRGNEAARRAALRVGRTFGMAFMEAKLAIELELQEEEQIDQVEVSKIARDRD